MLCNVCLNNGSCDFKANNVIECVSYVEKPNASFVAGEDSTNFSSRFMPNVKFKVDSVDGFPQIDRFPYKDRLHYLTSKDGTFVAVFFNERSYLDCDIKEVSIYEAIPELVPDGMVYDEKLEDIIKRDPHKIYNDPIGKHIMNEYNTLKSCNFKTKEIQEGLKALVNANASQILPKDFVKSDVNNPTPSYYGEKCVCGRKIDWYVISDLYRKNKGAAWDHAGKKLLRAGEGHKDLIKDIDEVIDSLNRWKEQIREKTKK